MSLQQEQIQVPQVLDAFPKDSKYYIKTFLVNDKLNQLGWKLNPEYIDRNIKKFVGKPLILTAYKNHPHSFKHYQQTGNVEQDLKEFIKLQEPFKIGNIIEINNRLAQGSINEYTAVVEIDNENAVKAFKEGKIPKYVSPSILRINSNDPWNDIKDFEALHLAIVDNPAFGVEVANIRRPCEGQKNECLNMLHQGGIVQNEKGDNPQTECPYEILKTVNNLYQSSVTSQYYDFVQSIPNAEQFRDLILARSKTDTEYTIVPKSDSNDISSINMKDNHDVQVTESAPAETVNPEQNVIANKIQEQQAESQKTPIGTPAKEVPAITEPSNVNPPGTEQQREEVEDNTDESPCAKAAAELNEKIALYDSKIKEFDEFKTELTKREKESKVTAKRNKIEDVIPKEYAGSEEERNKVIESLQKLPDVELDMVIERFIVPATKPRAVQRKHTDFMKNEVPANNVAQASNNKKNLKLKELNRIFTFTGSIVPNNQKRGINS